MDIFFKVLIICIILFRPLLLRFRAFWFLGGKKMLCSVHWRVSCGVLLLFLLPNLGIRSLSLCSCSCYCEHILTLYFHYTLQFYVETVKQMALRQLVPGSPLRTLCLLIAGQPQEVFGIVDSSNSITSGAVNPVQQPAQVSCH